MKNLLAGKRIVEKAKIWYIIPLVIILIAAIAFGIYAGINKSASQGMNIGIDFTGGTMVTVQVGDKLDPKNDKNGSLYKQYVNEVKAIVESNGGKYGYAQLTGADASTSVVIRYGLVSNEINAQIEDAVKDKYSSDNTIEVRSRVIGATASKQLIATAVGSVALSTLLILIYIAFRFRNLFTGLSAVVGLLHDVTMVIAFTIICNIQINSSFIAALITIVAYSINNTIVVFDRIRFNGKDAKMGGRTVIPKDIANISVAQTISRSICTTLTTLAAIVILAIIGVPSIREFALPVIFGLISGTFSSIFIAPSLYCNMLGGRDRFSKWRRAQKLKKAKA